MRVGTDTVSVFGTPMSAVAISNNAVNGLESGSSRAVIVTANKPMSDVLNVLGRDRIGDTMTPAQIDWTHTNRS